VSARCPNLGECYGQQTATVMIMGDRCTRDCRFCAVTPEVPGGLEADEPERVAKAAEEMGWRYVVLTSVTRDDLNDGGAEHFARTIGALRSLEPAPLVEVLTPDFQGNRDAWEVVADSRPDVWGHNVEVVPRLYADLRPAAGYEGSLELLRWAKERDAGMVTKSALMIGCGERRDEILEVCRDLREAKVNLVVIGQYLSPSGEHWPVKRFYTPEEFEGLESEVAEMGFAGVLAQPCARSSYRAEEMYRQAVGKG
jgi:lipoic acid synthetase